VSRTDYRRDLGQRRSIARITVTREGTLYVTCAGATLHYGRIRARGTEQEVAFRSKAHLNKAISRIKSFLGVPSVVTINQEFLHRLPDGTPEDDKE